jgi:hypothetical protein
VRVTSKPIASATTRPSPRVQQAFALVAAMKDVPFDFLEEGCVHRSHVVAKRLEERGIDVDKVFFLPHGSDLVMNTSKAKLGYTVVIYHEAVVLERKWVLDPSVADRPLTLDEWQKTMRPAVKDAKAETFFLPRFAYGLPDRASPPSTWRAKDLASANAWNTEWREAKQCLDESDFYDTLPKLAQGILD